MTWTYTTDINAGEFFGLFDPSGLYYLVTIPDGEQLVIPTTVGHYSQRFVPGFQLQLQVAP